MEFNAIEAFTQALTAGLAIGILIVIIRWVRP